MSTVHFSHLGVEDGDENTFEMQMCEVWEMLKADTRLRYARGQAERSDTGRMHFQIYTEWKTSLRLTQLLKVLPSHSEPLRGTRTQGRDYCGKKESRLWTLEDLGEWRPERGSADFGLGGPKQRALEYIVNDGLTPMQIAVKDPECYFTFHRAIHQLHKALRVATTAGVDAAVNEVATSPISAEEFRENLNLAPYEEE